MSQAVKCLVGGIVGFFVGLHVVVALLFVANYAIPGVKDPSAAGWDPLSVTIVVCMAFLAGAIVGAVLGAILAFRWN